MEVENMLQYYEGSVGQERLNILLRKFSDTLCRKWVSKSSAQTATELLKLKP
jgi:hypothetical protein